MTPPVTAIDITHLQESWALVVWVMRRQLAHPLSLQVLYWKYKTSINVTPPVTAIDITNLQESWALVISWTSVG